MLQLRFLNTKIFVFSVRIIFFFFTIHHPTPPQAATTILPSNVTFPPYHLNVMSISNLVFFPSFLNPNSSLNLHIASAITLRSSCETFHWFLFSKIRELLESELEDMLTWGEVWTSKFHPFSHITPPGLQQVNPIFDLKASYLLQKR